MMTVLVFWGEPEGGFSPSVPWSRSFASIGVDDIDESGYVRATLEVDRREITETRVQAVRVVPSLDELKHRHACLDLRAEVVAIKKLALQRGEETFAQGVVVG